MEKRKYLPCLFSVILLAGCSTETVNQDLGGLATASALVVAMPLIPVAMPFSAVRQINEANSDKALYAKLDPVYQKRIEMIKARSPQADADEVWAEKIAAFLPTTLNGDNYLGLGETDFNLKNGTENQEKIASNKLLTYLQTLFSDDPLQEQVHIWNKKYLEFRDVCGDYEKVFNLEMMKKIQASNR